MNKKIEKKQFIEIIIIAIIILTYFLYFTYRMQNDTGFKYIDETTGELVTNSSRQNVVYILFILLSVFLIFVYINLKEKRNKNSLKIEQVFLIVTSIFCVLNIIAMPMTAGHDESIHAMRVYEYSEGKFISNGENAYLEEGITNALESKHCYSDIFQNKESYSTKTNKVEWGYRVATYSPINYLPEIMGIITSRVFTTNSMIQLYVARVFNMIACITIIYFAIKIIPYGKNLLFLFSCIPIAIEGFSTISADGLLIALSFFFISYILYLREEKDRKIGKKEIIILTVTSIAISLCKTIYIVLLALLFLIPKEKWKSKKQAIIIILIIFISCAILDIGWYYLGVENESLISGNEALVAMTKNPINYISKIIYTIVLNFGKYTHELFGGSLEWNEQTNISVFPYILLITSILLAVNSKEKIEWSRFQILVIITVILSTIFLVFTSMYLGWSKLDIPEILGVQGRYFIPILPVIFLLLGRKSKDELTSTYNIANLIITMQLFVIMQLIIHHI